MFERYTEKARRVIFFARHEAATYGSPYIETEHLLLGLLREDRGLASRLGDLPLGEAHVRAEIEKRITARERISTSIEVPLTEECKTALRLAAEESARLGHRWIGTGHLMMGLLRVEKSLGATILIARGVTGKAIEEQMKEPETGYLAIAKTSGQVTLESFLAGLKSLKAEQLVDYFATQGEFVDASGHRWNREEIEKNFDSLFAHYAKKNASYTVETPLTDSHLLFVATVLWKNALLASEERAWIHRISAVLVAAGDEWKILLLHVTIVQASAFVTKKAQA
jgi:hypothetical protein